MQLEALPDMTNVKAKLFLHLSFNRPEPKAPAIFQPD
jgi:hypothetical protein